MTGVTPATDRSGRLRSRQNPSRCASPRGNCVPSLARQSGGRAALFPAFAICAEPPASPKYALLPNRTIACDLREPIRYRRASAPGLAVARRLSGSLCQNGSRQSRSSTTNPAARLPQTRSIPMDAKRGDSARSKHLCRLESQIGKRDFFMLPIRDVEGRAVRNGHQMRHKLGAGHRSDPFGTLVFGRAVGSFEESLDLRLHGSTMSRGSQPRAALDLVIDVANGDTAHIASPLSAMQLFNPKAA